VAGRTRWRGVTRPGPGRRRSALVDAVAHGDRADLTRPSGADEAEFLSAVRASRELHGDWVSPPADGPAFASYLLRLGGADHDGYFVRAKEDGRLAGVVNLNNIVRGSFQSAYIGYYAFVGGEGRGLLTEGVALLVGQAFGPLGLHRVEADIQPDNVRSVRLAERLGFRDEGLARRLLYIAGEWRDHRRFVMLGEDWPAGANGGQVRG
jgi:[ribosomal protein S5]-alanine N-acetyltransferase